MSETHCIEAGGQPLAVRQKYINTPFGVYTAFRTPGIVKVAHAHLLLEDAAIKANPLRGGDAKLTGLFHREVAGLPNGRGDVASSTK